VDDFLNTKGENRMIKIEVSVAIDRPVEEVFAFTTNLENASLFQPDVEESRQTSTGPVRVGTTWQEVRHMQGRRIESTNQVTQYEPNKRVFFKTASGPFPVEGGYTYEPVDGGTKLNIIGQAETSGFFKLADPLVAGIVKRQLEASGAILKDLLEAQAEKMSVR
jgi:uncharacterized membrane protein